MKKSILSLLCVVTCGILFIGNVSAAEERFVSTLEMPGGSTLVGQTRTGKFDYHKISLYPTTLVFSKTDTNGNDMFQVDITLQRKSLLTWSDFKMQAAKLYKTNTTYSYNMGNAGSGKFRYTFYTGNASTYYGQELVANPVYIYTYE